MSIEATIVGGGGGEDVGGWSGGWDWGERSI
jgi:hypothetical protein